MKPLDYAPRQSEAGTSHPKQNTDISRVLLVSNQTLIKTNRRGDIISCATTKPILVPKFLRDRTWMRKISAPRLYPLSLLLQAYAVTMEVESPGSKGAFGSTFEVSTTTFSRAPSLLLLEAVRSDAESSTVTVRYKLSEVSCWAVRN